MRRKGLLTEQEILSALDAAEEGIKRDNQATEVSSANLEAVQFPIRLLRAGTNLTAARLPSFTDLATVVGETKNQP